MIGLDKEVLNSLRETYKPGTIIRLIEMDDPYNTMLSGMLGRVTHVDDIGTVFAQWQNGSNLGAILDVDKIEVAYSDECGDLAWLDIKYSPYKLADITDIHLKNILAFMCRGKGHRFFLTEEKVTMLFKEAKKRELGLPYKLEIALKALGISIINR